MLIILSPSKSINFKESIKYKQASTPLFESDANMLVSFLSGFNVEEIAEREKISIRMALSTYEYIQTFSLPTSPHKEAIFAYNGNVFEKLQASLLSDESLAYLQKHLRICSALYGILRPFDKIKPYRLDMGSELIPDLYRFWKNKLTGPIIELLADHNYFLINLASAEYFKMLDLKKIPRQTRIITPTFLQEKNGKLTSNSLFIKQARGLMLKFIAENEITDPEYLQGFDSDGYYYNTELSTKDKWCFTK